MNEKIKEDLIKAMKSQDKVMLNTLRSIKGAVQLEVINNKTEANDDLVMSVISKQIKMRTDSITEFTKAGRLDLADSYQKEIDILKKYLPVELTEEELIKIIDDAFLVVKPTSIKDLGSLMKELNPKVKNRCDMKHLQELIRGRLN